MMKSELIIEMEDLLLEKIERQNRCLSLYKTLDDSVRADLCSAIFRSIDEEVILIGHIDLVFVSKLEKFKSRHNVSDLSELKREALDEFAMVKKAVNRILESDEKLNIYFDSTYLLRVKAKKDAQDQVKKLRMTSAYRNINKI
ncbi:hypothetical protein QE109_10650 [Fusibacter bizertensis]|uniref:Uncharacterized protein n=1 Tax=Fusibacter bizertensis TaxID=1488331 RepID=A0ABT6NDV3_9FIRM|nr:hypothetical protein [Fusibacter bizertensis]MDH8678609.1 hypothetical protein [Fusibacter bizertensis]